MLCVVVKLSAHTAHEMNDVRIILQILVEVDLDVVAVAAQVVSCKVNEHHMLRVLFRVITQIFGSSFVGLRIACALCRSCYGVDISLSSLYAAMGLG